MNIPFSPPDITDVEINEVVEVLRSGWITTGPKVKLLEKKLAELKGEILESMKKLSPREKELIECKFFKDKKTYLLIPVVGYLIQAFFNISVIEVAPMFYMALGLCINKDNAKILK